MAIRRIIIAVTNNLVTDHRVAKLALYLQNKGFEVFVVGRTWPGGKVPETRAGKHFRFRLLFNKGPLFYLVFNLRLLWFLLWHKAHKIVAIDLDALPASIIAGKIKNIPVVFDSHEYFPESPELQHRPFIKGIWSKIESLFIPYIQHGITVSPGIVNIYKQKYGVSFSLVRNVPYFSDEVFEIRPISDNPIIYYQGALNLGRGLEQSIEAMKFLPGYKLHIVGGGDVETELKELVLKLNLQEQVVFQGKVPFEELKKLGVSAHVGLCLLENLGLNYYYSMPNRLFDYPSLGLPIIATDFPDISSIVGEYNTGVLVRTLNPQEIAMEIKRACEDSTLRNKWKISLKEASEKLTWENETLILDEMFI